MAKRRKSRDHKPAERDAPDHRHARRAPADPRWREPELLTDDYPSPRRSVRPFDLWEPLQELEDRRTFHPDPYRPARSARRADVRLVVVPEDPPPGKSLLGRFWGLPARIGFSRPAGVPICKRRGDRRRVLHALQLAGRRGLGRGKRQHRNAYSSISC